MVHVQDISAGFSLASGLVSLFLFGVALRAYLHERQGTYGFLAAAFLLFSAKSCLVAFALWTGAIEHQMLELVDAVGDLATILLLTLPIFLPRHG